MTKSIFSLSIVSSLLVKQCLDVGYHLVRMNPVSVELNDVTLTIQKVLREVPLDLRVRGLLLEILVDRADVASNNIHFAKERECDSVVGDNPLFDRLLGLGLLGPELVARECKDLESSMTHSTVHLLVRSVVLVSKTSLRGYVYDDERLCSISIA